MRHALLLLLALVGCPSSSKTPEGSASATVLASASASTASVASTAPSLPPTPALTAGPIKVVGYPLTVSTGMNDPAEIIGFTKDSAEYGYCSTIGARDPATTNCDFVKRDGSHHTLSSEDAKGFSAKQLKALQEWVKDQGVPTIAPSKDFTKRLANPLKGTWAFTDITIWVNPVGADGVKTNAQLKIGGVVDGEPVVYPIVLEPKPMGPVKYHTAIANDLSLSPDGAEIGAVGSFFCMEWCNDFQIYRAPVGAFASLVYNDAGFKRHKKGDYARAAELFSKAANADASAKLPAYNLACAWARLKDPRAKDALAVAIQRDPSVKSRAPADEDFAGVKTEAWFTALVR